MNIVLARDPDLDLFHCIAMTTREVQSSQALNAHLCVVHTLVLGSSNRNAKRSSTKRPVAWNPSWILDLGSEERDLLFVKV